MLRQTDADELLALPKVFEGGAPSGVMEPGQRDRWSLVGAEHPAERFYMDTSRGRLRTTKLKYQTRTRGHIVLARLDVDGPPHTNPDGVRVGRTHLHLYVEGYDDKFAWPLDQAAFSEPSYQPRALADFCKLCHVIDLPEGQIPLPFS